MDDQNIRLIRNQAGTVIKSKCPSQKVCNKVKGKEESGQREVSPGPSGQRRQEAKQTKLPNPEVKAWAMFDLYPVSPVFSLPGGHRDLGGRWSAGVKCGSKKSHLSSLQCSHEQILTPVSSPQSLVLYTPFVCSGKTSCALISTDRRAKSVRMPSLRCVLSTG